MEATGLEDAVYMVALATSIQTQPCLIFTLKEN
jgi:hypothetical protein